MALLVSPHPYETFSASRAASDIPVAEFFDTPNKKEANADSSGINRHKQEILTPALHACQYSPDSNRYDLLPFLRPYVQAFLHVDAPTWAPGIFWRMRGLCSSCFLSPYPRDSCLQVATLTLSFRRPLTWAYNKIEKALAEHEKKQWFSGRIISQRYLGPRSGWLGKLSSYALECQLNHESRTAIFLIFIPHEIKRKLETTGTTVPILDQNPTTHSQNSPPNVPNTQDLQAYTTWKVALQLPSIEDTIVLAPFPRTESGTPWSTATQNVQERPYLHKLPTMEVLTCCLPFLPTYSTTLPSLKPLPSHSRRPDIPIQAATITLQHASC